MGQARLGPTRSKGSTAGVREGTQVESERVSHSVVSDSATPWTVTHQASLPMGFSRQKYWSGLPCPPPGDLPNPGIKPRSPPLQADSLLELLLRLKGTKSAEGAGDCNGVSSRASYDPREVLSLLPPPLHPHLGVVITVPALPHSQGLWGLTMTITTRKTKFKAIKHHQGQQVLCQAPCWHNCN